MSDVTAQPPVTGEAVAALVDRPPSSSSVRWSAPAGTGLGPRSLRMARHSLSHAGVLRPALQCERRIRPSSLAALRRFVLLSMRKRLLSSPYSQGIRSLSAG